MSLVVLTFPLGGVSPIAPPFWVPCVSDSHVQSTLPPTTSARGTSFESSAPGLAPSIPPEKPGVGGSFFVPHAGR